MWILAVRTPTTPIAYLITSNNIIMTLGSFHIVLMVFRRIFHETRCFRLIRGRFYPATRAYSQGQCAQIGGLDLRFTLLFGELLLLMMWL